MNEKEFYRREIIKMVEGIKNPAILKYILSVIKSYLKNISQIRE